jgi:uncharacterized short protein YbdD (DUF466 family)
MSKPSNDLPPEAARSQPLAQIFRTCADPGLVKEYRYLEERLEREGRRVYVGSPRNPERVELDPYNDHNRYLLDEMRKVMDRIDGALLAKLGSGELTAWGREGSPVAAWREIPTAAWKNLQFDDFPKGTVKGPGDVILYDVHVGARVEQLEVGKSPPRIEQESQSQPEPAPLLPQPPLPTTGAPGRPSNMHLVEAEFERRRQDRRMESSLAREAAALAAWFKAAHPDKQPVTAKTIANRLRARFRGVAGS